MKAAKELEGKQAIHTQAKIHTMVEHDPTPVVVSTQEPTPKMNETAPKADTGTPVVAKQQQELNQKQQGEGEGEVMTAPKKNSHSKIVAPKRRDGMADVTDRDVLSGRGGCTNTHNGNRLFRRLVRVNQATYKDVRTSPSVKHLLAISIIEAIRRHGGRFMQRDTKNKRWIEVPPKEARNKTTQALRGEVYLKNPGKGDWYAKKRPEPGTRKRPEAGGKTATPNRAKPASSTSDEKQDSISASLLSKQYVYESLMKEKAAMNADDVPYPSNLPTEDKAKATRATAANDEDKSVFLDALEGMAALPCKEKNGSSSTIVPKKRKGKLNEDDQNAASGLMSLAAIAGAVAEREGMVDSEKNHEVIYGEKKLEARQSYKAVVHHQGPVALHGFGTATTKKPLISPSLSPAIVPPNTGAPPMMPLGGSLPINPVAAAASAVNFEVAHVSYNANAGQPGAAARTRVGTNSYHYYSSLDHQNWNLSAEGLAAGPPASKLFGNPMMRQGASLLPLSVNGLPQHHPGLGRAGGLEGLARKRERELCLREAILREEICRSSAEQRRHQILLDAAAAGGFYKNMLPTRNEGSFLLQQQSPAWLCQEENVPSLKNEYGTMTSTTSKEVEVVSHSKESVGPLKKRKWNFEEQRDGSPSKLHKAEENEGDEGERQVFVTLAKSSDPSATTQRSDDKPVKEGSSGGRETEDTESGGENSIPLEAMPLTKALAEKPLPTKHLDSSDGTESGDKALLEVS